MGTPINVPKDFNINLDTLDNLENFMPSYDKKFDVFALSPKETVPAVSLDWDGEFWVRVAENGEIVGVEVEDFESVFLKKYPEIAKVWQDGKEICLALQKETEKTDSCQYFIKILVEFLSNLFLTRPQQRSFISP